jgi:hypothetical protein
LYTKTVSVERSTSIGRRSARSAAVVAATDRSISTPDNLALTSDRGKQGRITVSLCRKLEQHIRQMFSRGHEKAMRDRCRDVEHVAGPEQVPFAASPLCTMTTSTMWSCCSGKPSASR